MVAVRVIGIWSILHESVTYMVTTILNGGGNSTEE
jgi:hypothetical protein